jgi:hypothetical protein
VCTGSALTQLSPSPGGSYYAIDQYQRPIRSPNAPDTETSHAGRYSYLRPPSSFPVSPNAALHMKALSAAAASGQTYLDAVRLGFDLDPVGDAKELAQLAAIKADMKKGREEARAVAEKCME